MQERQYKVPKLLYKSDELATMGHLAADVNCSPKTIRDDLKRLGSFLEEYGLGKIVSKSNKGVYLMKGKGQNTAKQTRDDMNRIELYGTDKHSQILELPLKQGSIQKMRLEQRLLISRLGAGKAASQVPVRLATHRIAVICEGGQGLQIECSEYYWRIAMRELFADIFRKRQEFGDQTLRGQIGKFLWGFNMAGVTRAIMGLKKKSEIHYSFNGYQQLSFLLPLCVIRIRKEEYVEISADSGRQKAEWQGLEYDLSMAKICMEDSKEYYHIGFPEGEKQLTVLILGAAKIQEFTDETSRQTYMETNQNICRMVDKAISVTGNILGQGLNRGDYPFDSLLLHMKSRVLKLRYGIPEENPLREVVKSKYPNICVAAQSASLIIEPKPEVRIGENEVVYLVLYIGGAIRRLSVGVKVCTLCNHDIGISRILEEQVGRSMQNTNVVSVLTTKDTCRIQRSQCDFLTSSIPVGGMLVDGNVVQTGDVLRPQGVQRIRNKMKQVRKRKVRRITEKTELSEYQLSHSSLVYHFPERAYKKKIIFFLYARLAGADCVIKDYEQTALNGKETISTVPELRVVIPYGAAFCICRLVITAAILEKPVDWDEDRRVGRIFPLILNLDERFKVKGQVIRLYSTTVTLLGDKEIYEEFRSLGGQEEIAGYSNSIVKGDRKT